MWFLLVQDPKYAKEIQDEIEHEKKKKVELLKREKQLKSQIENLINDSLNLLKSRLNELGIQAKSPPEFIEKAKGIVCQHHELQRNKAAMENEVKQLEHEQEKMIQAKEKEMLEHLLKQGIPMPEAKKKVKITIENTIANLQNSENKVSPLLNKLADVTLTKCEQLPTSTQIRKRPVVAKQRDWPEKKIRPEEWQEMTKIEEKNPEMLAKKILAAGRNIENNPPATSKMLLSPRSKDPLIVPQQQSRGSVEVEVRRIEQTIQPQNKVQVDLPRVDLTNSLNAQSQEALVLPAHPGSRSSEHTEDVTYHTNKMSATPRAEQFEDRLKTIIHSVLSGDEKDQKANNKPMFSPVKKELPTHLPMPPNVKNSPALPQMGMPRSVNEIIEKEIERNLSANEPPGQPRRLPPGPPMSPQKLVRPPPSSSSMSRMSQVIEDSLRAGHPAAVAQAAAAAVARGAGGPELEGLACPRTKSPPPGNGVPGGAHPNPKSQIDFHHEYPAMEGLGARFSSYLEKRGGDFPTASTGASSKGPPGPGPGNWPEHHPNASYRYPGHFQQQQPMTSTYNMPPRKRSSPLTSSILPPKKQHIDNAGVDYSFHKGKIKYLID